MVQQCMTTDDLQFTTFFQLYQRLHIKVSYRSIRTLSQTAIFSLGQQERAVALIKGSLDEEIKQAAEQLNGFLSEMEIRTAMTVRPPTWE